jgi:REP element-mobilizing transposase RayT
MPPSKLPILAHHIVLSSCGFWLSNDPRGSGSDEIRAPKLDPLGPIHHGRQRLQPSRDELRRFYQQAFPRLDQTPIWFDEAKRSVIAEAFADVVTRCRYTVWACFIGSNHAHLCIRRHRDPYQTMWGSLTAQTRTSLIARGLAPEFHRVWAERPYSVFLHTPEDIRRVIAYIENNAPREGLPAQRWPFVRAYDGWPFAGGPATR